MSRRCYYAWCQHYRADRVCRVDLTCGSLTFYAADCYIIRYWVYVSDIDGDCGYVAVDCTVVHFVAEGVYAAKASGWDVVEGTVSVQGRSPCPGAVTIEGVNTAELIASVALT